MFLNWFKCLKNKYLMYVSWIKYSSQFIKSVLFRTIKALHICTVSKGRVKKKERYSPKDLISINFGYVHGIYKIAPRGDFFCLGTDEKKNEFHITRQKLLYLVYSLFLLIIANRSSL